MDQQPDSLLIERAKAGDQEAFAELYTRYFDPVYDFVARMTRDRDEAADIAQDTFVKAMNALGGLQKGASFKSWIFTIARNTALNRLERSSRTRPLTFTDEDGEEASFDVVDTDRFGDPAEAAEARAISALVWEAAAGLDPKQLSLLDLHLRQGLDSGEIADVLGVTKNNGYVMLNRLKKAVEDAIGAFVMLHNGRRYCEQLDAALTRAGIGQMTPEVRKIVDRHIAACDECEERRRKLVAPLAVFSAFAMVGSPVGVKAQVLDHLMQNWPGPATTGAAAAGAGGGTGSAGLGSGTLLKIVAGLGLAATLLLGAVLVPAGPLSLTRNDGRSQEADAAEQPAGTSLSPSVGGSGGGGATSSPGPGAPGTPGPSPSESGTPDPGAGAVVLPPTGSDTPTPTATPTPPGTPTPTPGPGTPTATPTPISAPTATPTKTVPPTPSPTRTPTPPPCNPSLATSTTTLNAGSGSPTTLTLINSGCSAANFSAAPQAGWLTLTPGAGSVPPNGSIILTVTPSASSLGEGQFSGTFEVSWAGGTIPVTVLVNHPGSAPQVTVSASRCGQGPGAPYAFRAYVSDDYAVGSVTLSFIRTDNTSGSVTMSMVDGAYAASGNAALKSWSIVATDQNSPTPHTTTVSGSCQPT